MDFRVRISSWIFELDFRVRISSWIFELDFRVRIFELDFRVRISSWIFELGFFSGIFLAVFSLVVFPINVHAVVLRNILCQWCCTSSRGLFKMEEKGLQIGKGNLV